MREQKRFSVIGYRPPAKYCRAGLSGKIFNHNAQAKHRTPNTEVQTGFTLLELLIALAISSIIFLVIISTYSLTMNMIEKWNYREEDYYLARNVFRRMHDEISSLYFVSASSLPKGQTAETATFEGDAKKFSFYTTAKSIYFPFSCLTKITYKFIITDEEKKLLIREEEPMVNFSLEENRYLKSYVWSENLEDFSFQYSDGKIWYDSIKKGQKLKTIRILLTSSHEETFSTIIYIPMGI